MNRWYQCEDEFSPDRDGQYVSYEETERVAWRIATEIRELYEGDRYYHVTDEMLLKLVTERLEKGDEDD